MDLITAVIGAGLLVIGLVIGLIVGWLVCKVLAESESTTLRADHERAFASIESAHRETVATLNGRLEQIATAQEIVEKAREQLNTEFQSTASKVLQTNNEQFVQLANASLGKTLESARSEFHQRHQQFEHLVKPLAENYANLNPKIEQLDGRVQSFTEATARLEGALKGDNRAVGTWGEIQLRRVVELAGMTDYCDFAEQLTIGALQSRPDLIIRLPERRVIVVDAKASTAAYLEAGQAGDDESAQSAAFSRHASALRTQIDGLSRRDYGRQVPEALDFVVMFVPGDQFLSAAIRANPGLVEYAMDKRVAIATPASLIAMLWAVANGWQQYEIAQNAEEIRHIGAQMHGSLTEFIKAYATVEQRIRQTVDAFNGSVRVMENQLLDPARAMASMGVGNVDGLQSVSEVSRGLRQLPMITPDSTVTPDSDERIA